MLQGALSVLFRDWDEEGMGKMPRGHRIQGRKPSQVLVSSDAALLVLDDPSYFVSL